MAYKIGDDITINIPFTYTIGEEGYYTKKKLLTPEDCKEELLAEIKNGVLNTENILMEVKE